MTRLSDHDLDVALHLAQIKERDPTLKELARVTVERDDARKRISEANEEIEEMHQALGEPHQRSPLVFAAMRKERDQLRANNEIAQDLELKRIEMIDRLMLRCIEAETATDQARDAADRAISDLAAALNRSVDQAKEMGRMRERIKSLRASCDANYGGGYRKIGEGDIFAHGMHTVCNVVESWLEPIDKTTARGE